MEYRYMTLKDVVQDSAYSFKIGQLRDYLLRRKKNGLEKAVRKIGKTIYLRRDLFNEWIESYATQECEEGGINA